MKVSNKSPEKNRTPGTNAGPDTRLLEVVDVTKRFGAVRAVDSANLTVARSQIVGLVGANGAGKSTLINLISGVTQPDTGKLLIEGRPIQLGNPMDARFWGIETVYQDLALLNELDVTANIFMGRELCRRTLGVQWLAEKAMKAKVTELIRKLGYDFGAGSPVRFLSGGQRQAVALARALYSRAKIILLDEPTAALGVQETQRTLDLIRSFRERGVSLLVVSHELEDVFAIADRIVVMKNGTVVADRMTQSTTHDEIVSLIMRGDTSLSSQEGR